MIRSTAPTARIAGITVKDHLGRVLATNEETEEDDTGHELDDETGLHYAGARYYMSALGRWTSTDPILHEGTAKSLMNTDALFLSTSPYNYAFGNPVSLKDPDGRCPLPPNLCAAAAGGLIGGIAGGGMEAVKQYMNDEPFDGGAILGETIKGGTVGFVAGLTGGASLGGSVAAGTVSNVAGGVAGRSADRAVSGESDDFSLSEEASAVTRDALSGGIGGGLGRMLGPQFDDAASFFGLGGDNAGEVLVRTVTSEAGGVAPSLAVDGVIDGATSSHSEASIRDDLRRLSNGEDLGREEY